MMVKSKKIVSVLLILISFSTVFAAGKKDNKSEIKERAVEVKHLSNGLPVYFMNNDANHIDCVLVGIKGGTQYYTSDKAGIEHLTMQMLGKGSSNYDFRTLQNVKWETSSTYMASTGQYGSRLSLTTIDEHLEKILPVFLDGVVNPVFKKNEFDKLVQDARASIQNTMNDPFSIAFYYSDKVIYDGHPFSVKAGCTPESIENITLEDVMAHYDSIMDSRRIYVIAITKRSADEILPYFEQALGSIKTGTEELKVTDIPEIKINHEPMAFTHLSATGTAHVFRAYNGPSVKSNEWIPFEVAQSIYNKVLYNVIRGKYGSCYSTWSQNSNMEAVTTIDVIYNCSDFSDIKAQLQEAKEILKNGKYIKSINSDGSFIYGNIKDGFEGFRNSLINSTYELETTTASRAAKLNTSLCLFDDTATFNQIFAKLNTVTYEEVQSVIDKYILSEDEFWFGITGPESEEILLQALKK